MSKFNLVSSRRLIAELFTDYNITGTDWVNKAQRHITRAIELMQIDGYFEFKTSFDLVREGRVPLPCESKYLIGVLVKNDHCICRLPLTRELTFNQKLNGLIYHQYHKGYINNNYLNTTFNDGEVCFLYYGIPTDEEGDLMIPDNAELFEAIPYFIIYKLSFSGYKHPAIKPSDAYQMWEAMFPRASNTINYPSIEEMQHFTEVNTNPLYIDLLKCNGIDFKTTADRFYKSKNLLSGGGLAGGNTNGIGDGSNGGTGDGTSTGGNGTTIINTTTTINKTVVESNIQGWILLHNPDYTVSQPFTGDANIPFRLPTNNVVLEDKNATDELRTLVNADSTINLTNINDSYLGSVTFKIKAAVPSREGELIFKLLDNFGETSDIDISGGQFVINDDAGIEKTITINLPFYILEDVQNYDKLYLEATVECDFELYDIQFYIANTYNG